MRKQREPDRLPPWEVSRQFYKISVYGTYVINTGEHILVVADKFSRYVWVQFLGYHTKGTSKKVIEFLSHILPTQRVLGNKRVKDALDDIPLNIPLLITPSVKPGLPLTKSQEKYLYWGPPVKPGGYPVRRIMNCRPSVKKTIFKHNLTLSKLF